MERYFPNLVAFAAALLVALVLTPAVRTVLTHVGMVDKPDKRRINKVPVPRGGGLAVMLALVLGYWATIAYFGYPETTLLSRATMARLSGLGVALALWGLLDDRVSLKPLVKLFGQIAVAFLVWSWAGVGFSRIWPSLPAWVDAPLTVFWIVGAINAFNLIDGLDGLAAGLGLIATLGITGSVLVANIPCGTIVNFAFAGALLGFLVYNYNPASIFLGDCGSMFIGYVVSVLPLAFATPDSLIVSLGVPLLAMGVPIFDTSLAIVRRTIRHFLNRASASGEVMSADTDHLHHRLLRSYGFSQRKVAWVLYGGAALLVLFGLLNACLVSRRAALWLVGLAVGAVVIFRDMARIELFDAARLLEATAHDRAVRTRRRWARATVTLYLLADVFALALAYTANVFLAGRPLTREFFALILPIRLVFILTALVVFQTYRTVWARADSSNYVRLVAAVFVGTVLGSLVLGLVRPELDDILVAETLSVVALLSLALASVRLVRPAVREFLYDIAAKNRRDRKDTVRVLVYGAGLRYRVFRRELVRHALDSRRMIVGLVDDDILLRGHLIGTLRVLGTIHDVPQLIVRHNIDEIVIACEITDEWARVVRGMLQPTGVKVTYFSLSEREF